MSDVNHILWWSPTERIKQPCLQSDQLVSQHHNGFYSPFKQHYSYITHAPYSVNFSTPMISNEICEPASIYEYRYEPYPSFATPFINLRLLITETSNDLSTYASSIAHSTLGQQRTSDQFIEGFIDLNSTTLLKQSQLGIIPPESHQTVFTSLTENITQFTSSPIKSAYTSNDSTSMEESKQGATHTNEFATLVSNMSSQRHSTNSDIYSKPRRQRILEEENRRDARRRERNRLAARRHRNKKRYKSDQLENQVHELMIENERLKGLEAEVERLKGLLNSVQSEIN
ncbi:14699_t:CDS:2 [Dentiscutata erythropus]|uniref:14699_t:CDS:1 n=1 Tax=Dentiscutata erythropus TaxID=1348616 RepID=A0A9N9DK18_9GLOM|nr:14699_t:CDS:2 [Dentiscutata erythropus]